MDYYEYPQASDIITVRRRNRWHFLAACILPLALQMGLFALMDVLTRPLFDARLISPAAQRIGGGIFVVSFCSGI